MKKKQISLKSINVKSFITVPGKSTAIKGGTGGCNTADDPFFCTHYGTTEDPVSGPGPTATCNNTCGCSGASCDPTCSPLNTFCCPTEDYTRYC